MSTPVPACAAAIAGATSPSRISLTRAPACAELADQLLVPVALEHDDVDLARATFQRLRDGVTFSVGLA